MYYARVVRIKFPIVNVAGKVLNCQSSESCGQLVARQDAVLPVLAVSPTFLSVVVSLLVNHG